MLLSFTAIDKSLEIREFTCYIPKLETAFSLLSRISEKGDKMLNVRLTDEGSDINLPPEAFDGQPMAGAIQELEKQWQAILQKPVRTTVLNRKLRIDVARQQLTMYDCRIDQFIQVIDHIELLRQQTEDRINYDLIRTKLIGRYDLILATYQQYIVRTQVKREATLEKLSQLEHNYAG